MKPEAQTAAVSELDGKLDHWNDCVRIANKQCRNKDASTQYEWAINLYGYNYLNSRDAIIPLIEKYINTWELAEAFGEALSKLILESSGNKNNELQDWQCAMMLLFSTPAQLVEAFLRAMKKWKD